ncbi:hypothetical protein OD917_20990 [Flavobacterium sp. SH_e]|uniref:hypothetical protein n=1 Tax=Flavobacterium sp. SH_e TaxID=2983767 RepID=UPI0021E3E89F|nr:hypothetical protein [Flavobacterium sp. SH_e]MCV2487423.1 hypothetical protein [Flavobacterium sp. SH_e]
MKNRLLPLLFVLGGYSVYSQVVVGKKEVTTPSAQLEVYATDKGILIPNVKLTGSTDATTIKTGNEESLLVFNTATVTDVKPGYYYWYAGKWQRLAVSGEITSGKDGIAGGNGAPGTDGVSIPAEANLYIDYNTKTVYVLKPNSDPKDPNNWIPTNGKNGIDGIAGVDGRPGEGGQITTLDAILKDGFGNIYAYVGDSRDVAVRNADWQSKASTWVKINGSNGADGLPGAEGTKGADGQITTLDAIIRYNNDIYAYVGDSKTTAGRTDEWNSGSANWVKISGLNGLDGKNGIAGGNGLPGDQSPALDPSIQIYVDYTSGKIYVRDPKNEGGWITSKRNNNSSTSC